MPFLAMFFFTSVMVCAHVVLYRLNEGVPHIFLVTIEIFFSL